MGEMVVPSLSKEILLSLERLVFTLRLFVDFGLQVEILLFVLGSLGLSHGFSRGSRVSRESFLSSVAVGVIGLEIVDITVVVDAVEVETTGEALALRNFLFPEELLLLLLFALALVWEVLGMLSLQLAEVVVSLVVNTSLLGTGIIRGCSILGGDFFVGGTTWSKHSFSLAISTSCKTVGG